jgi:hypothetical protein
MLKVSPYDRVVKKDLLAICRSRGIQTGLNSSSTNPDMIARLLADDKAKGREFSEAALMHGEDIRRELVCRCFRGMKDFLPPATLKSMAAKWLLEWVKRDSEFCSRRVDGLMLVEVTLHVGDLST